MQATGPLLKEKGYISYVDVFMKLGYLDLKDYEDWRRKGIPYLEKVIKVNLARINFVMKAIRQNSLNGKLKPSWTSYKSWGKGRKIDLRFSKSGEGNIEPYIPQFPEGVFGIFESTHRALWSGVG